MGKEARRNSAMISTFRDLKAMSGKNNSKISSPNFDPDNLENYMHDDFQIGKEDESVALVIDGSSAYRLGKAMEYSLGNRKFSLDYDGLNKIVEANFTNCTRKWFIASQVITRGNAEEPQGYSPIRSMLDWLQYHNYIVVTRDSYVDAPIENDHSDRNKPYHPPLDVDITTCLFRASRVANRIIFFGSDAKYEPALKTLRDEFGKHIVVVSATFSNGRKFVADELRKVGNFVDINDSWYIDRLNSKRNDSVPTSFVKTPEPNLIS